MTITFQLTASQGGWPGYHFDWDEQKFISTHSLTRRLTATNLAAFCKVDNFNSQPHKEADADMLPKSQKIKYFNSQPHKEADICLLTFIRISGIFQLTASQGGWRRKNTILYLQSLFQLTASQGGWQFLQQRMTFTDTFQLTASQGGWRFKTIWNRTRKNFNSQPHKEADAFPHRHYMNGKRFQLTASQGGWLIAVREQWNRRAFQLTASQGGWLRGIPRLKYSGYFNSQPHKEADHVTGT